MNRAIFLDRDGTLTRDDHPGKYTYQIEDYGLIPTVVEALQKLSKDYKLIVITNQGSIAKGVVTLEQYYAFSNHMKRDLAKYGIKFDGIYFCQHHSDISECECRKPKPGMIFRAAKEHNIDLKESWMIGNSLSDILAGQSAGCKSILVNSSKDNKEAQFSFVKPDHTTKDLLVAANIILK